MNNDNISLQTTTIKQEGNHLKESSDLDVFQTRHNTSKSTDTWIKTYQAWSAAKGMEKKIEEYCPTDLNNILKLFYSEVKRTDGQEYEPNSLRVMQSGLYRYLQVKGYPKSIICDIEFQTSQATFEEKVVRLKAEAAGRLKNLSLFTQETEEYLWKNGRLGHGSPTTVLHTMWYFISKYFGIKSKDIHVMLKMEDFRRKVDENGTPFIELWCDQIPEIMKDTLDRAKEGRMTATGGTRCPVTLFEFYVSKRPAHARHTSRFYLHPIPGVCYENLVWYKHSPIGKLNFRKLMKTLQEPQQNSTNNLSNNLSESDASGFIQTSSSPIPQESICTKRPLSERVEFSEEGDYAVIKVPRKRNLDGNEVSSKFPAIPSVLYSKNSHRLETLSNFATSDPTLNVNQERTTGNNNVKNDNIFTHTDENGSINVFYNCNVTIVQSDPKEVSRKRPYVQTGCASPEY